MSAFDSTADQPVTVISTYTTDHVPLDHGTTADIRGGPAHYIGLAFERLSRPYVVITGAHAEVEVVRLPEGEAYRIPSLPSIPVPDDLHGCATILSPINREIAPDTKLPADTLLAIDLQGFVRNPGRLTSDLDSEVDLKRLLGVADVVKGAPEEVAALDSGSRALLGRCIVLETRGSAGVDLHYGGRTTRIVPEQVSTDHTIGAGDTLLAAFVDALMRGSGPEAAVKQAAAVTSSILRERAALKPGNSTLGYTTS